jgi:hypothetical protein
MSETNKVYNSICECFSKSDAKRIADCAATFLKISIGHSTILEFLWKYANGRESEIPKLKKRMISRNEAETRA